MDNNPPITTIPEIKLEEGAVTLQPKTRFASLDKFKKIFKRAPKIAAQPHKSHKTIFIVLAVILGIIIVLGLAIGIPGMAIYSKAKVLEADAKNIKASFTKQDINEVETAVAKLKTDMQSFQSSYKLLSWMKIVPVAGSYWADGDHAIKGGLAGLDAAQIGITTAKPYADIIGFTSGSKKAANAEENANDRIQFIVNTIKDILPKVGEVSQKAQIAKTEIDQIDPNRYPAAFAGKPVRETLRSVISLVDEATTMVVNSKPLLEAAPYMMGIDSPRTYLVLFQNNTELRPTGGFVTGYSVMTVDKGKINDVSSSDIYNLDKAYTPAFNAPDPIVKYLKGPYVLSKGLRLRDMNFNPDFKTSMQMFLKEAQKAGIPDKIDGVIAVDTQTLVNLLNAIGTVGVPGYGNFNANVNPKCNCPDVIYQLELSADVEGPIVWSENEPGKIVFAPANYLNRKALVGPLMNSVLKNVLGQPKDKIQNLVTAAWNSLTEKHVLFYMLNDKAQAGVEAFDLAGRIQNTPANADYFMAVDANLGGRKSNLYVTNEVEQDINVAADGTVTKTVTLTYKNSQSYDGWLNSVLPSWVRIYVPKGSTLISIDGVTDKQSPYEDAGKTVFAGLYSLRPQGVATITVKYKLPFKVKGQYDLYLQKQPGVDSVIETLKVNRQEEDIILKTDQQLRFKI